MSIEREGQQEGLRTGMGVGREPKRDCKGGTIKARMNKKRGAGPATK